MALLLYSPLNFVVGVHVWLVGRTQLDFDQALEEAHQLAPRWPYQSAARLLGVGVALMVATALVVLCAPAVKSLASAVSARTLGQVAGLAVVGLAAWAAVPVLLRAARGYAYFCRLGAAHRSASIVG